MENRPESEEETQNNNQENSNDGSLLRRLNSSVLGLRSTTKSFQRDPETFRTAFIHSAAIIFVLVCGACGLLAYRILEPFLRCILWSILAGAFLFPFKNYLILKTFRILRQKPHRSMQNFKGYQLVNTLSPDSLSNEKLEKDVLQLWDHFYEYMSNTSTLLLPDKNRSTTIYSPKDHSLRIPNFDFHLSDLYVLVHNNLDFLRNVLDSVWKNTTLLLTLLSTIISLLFTGGFALLNFLVSFIVFVTLLFYLLSHSDEPTYRPTEWLNNTISVGGKGLGKAVNDAVTSVFVASLKIAAFYGLYTYVLHTIVGSNLVFLPAVIASICAVTLKSYWAALPGCLDVWLVQQRPLAALILLLGQIAPTYVVDTAIYSEVKGGGHQYLTALAIAGGVYYRGIEGALIGPIVLCCLLVGVRLYNETMATTLSSNQEQEPLTSSLNHQTQPLMRSHSEQ
ncbi:unnamed protein product [Rotaria sp. Silwood2]|nr:unnamed protein product [Rotaria sp. Silwood2]